MPTIVKDGNMTIIDGELSAAQLDDIRHPYRDNEGFFDVEANAKGIGEGMARSFDERAPFFAELSTLTGGRKI